MRYRAYTRFGRALLRVSAAAGMAAVFLGMFAVGALRWDVLPGVGGLAGAALLAVAAARVYGRERRWIRGYGHVVMVSPRSVAVRGDCTLTLTVEAPGVGPKVATVRQYRVPAHLWPSAGDRLPIEVTPYGRLRVRVLWDHVPLMSATRGGEPSFAGADQ
ncbi:MAG: hypothetical protein HOV79_11800 [Hamadaea sp.]|nr:hypothetical protein [Hamadaea sp.]